MGLNFLLYIIIFGFNMYYNPLSSYVYVIFISMCRSVSVSAVCVQVPLEVS